MEIERKWFIKNLPDLNHIQPVSFERYFLFIGDKIEIRIQKKGNIYEFERKVEINQLSRKEEVFEITKEEYDELKKFASKSIVRDSYLFQENPEISIKVYKGIHEGLIRAEVEFPNEEDAKSFTPLSWFGDEITNSPVGRDKSLITLSLEEFSKIIVTLKK